MASCGLSARTSLVFQLLYFKWRMEPQPLVKSGDFDRDKLSGSVRWRWVLPSPPALGLAPLRGFPDPRTPQIHQFQVLSMTYI